MPKNVSIILPAMNDVKSFKVQIKALLSQTRAPHEIMIIDSSSDQKIHKEVESLSHLELIKYFKTGKAFKFDRYLRLILNSAPILKNFFQIKSTRMYPSEATNFGAEHASGEFLALIDMSTIPEKDWLERSLKLLSDSTEVVFGSTKYESSSFFQKCIHFSTFGYAPQESNPGTLIRRSSYLANKMKEGVRAGADLEWRERIKQNCSWVLNKQSILKYIALPDSVFKFIKKMFVYQMHSAFLKIQLNTKDMVAFFSLLLLTLVISRWNYLVGWESSLYIPHITKISLLIMNIFLLQLIFLRRLGYSFFNRLSLPSLSKLLVSLIFFTAFFISYRWNAIIAGWIESSQFYIPHLTKIYFGFLLTMLIIYRGLYFPLISGVGLRELLPFKFLGIGLMGAFGDFAKLPGFIIGSIASLFFGRNDEQ